jgi:leader peptidase (prepilin peptidase)/N-methyltransferase
VVTTQWLLAIAAIVLGAIVGSFLNVVIHRLPLGTFWSGGARSRCPACGAPIRSFDNVPVVSWVLLRGRARCCAAPIAARYPIVEAATAALFGLLWISPPSGLEFREPDFDGLALAAFVFHAFFAANLVANAFIDIQHRILPNELTKSGMVVGCLFGLFVGTAGRLPIAGIGPGVSGLLFSAVGLVVGLAATWAIRFGARAVFREEALGFGDVKLMGMIGAFLGWEDALLTFFLGCVLGAVFGTVHRWLTGDRFIYFGPFLALGALISLFVGPRLRAALGGLQRWQIESSSAPAWTAVFLVLAVALLIFLIRRGRSR